LANRRILYIVGEYPSLTETFIGREIAALRSLGLDITVFSLRDCEWSRACLASIGCAGKLRRLAQDLCSDETALSRYRTIGAALRAAEIAVRADACDHIHAHFLGLPATVAFCLSRLLGKPYSVTAHARDIYAEPTPECVVRRACFRTTCTESNRRHLAQKYPDVAFELVRHGLDVTPYTPAVPIQRDGLCRLLAVGRLVEKKGFAYLIRACKVLQERSLPWRCMVIGEGPLRPSLENEIAVNNLQHRMVLVGAKAHGEVIRLLQSADVVVAPSIVAENGDRDGVPNVILEAMAAGAPVVATDAGAITEAVEHRRTGWLVPQRDPVAIADAVQALWEQPLLGAALSEAARQHLLETFQPARWAYRLQRLLDASPGATAAVPTLPDAAAPVG
jgi:glycosyltransferase involved in cell wall biosynthesis